MSATQDIREMLWKSADKNVTKSQEQEQDQRPKETPEPTQTTHYGPEVSGQEIVKWEETFRQHIEETRKLEKEGEDKIEKAQKMEKKWKC